MSDKYLTEKEWKSFSKNAAYKADALIKALAALEKGEKAGPDDQLKLLDEVEKQADKLRGDNKNDKVLGKYLDEVDKAGKDLRKDLEKAAKEAEQDAEDDEPGSALLDPKKLLAQLTLCKRDPERTVQFGFVDAKDKQDAVLAMSPKMSGRKLFAKLQAETGVKTGAYGTAWVDGTSLMLQLDKPLSGLVKKVRGPVKACGFKIAKAVLWNADGTVFEQDEQDEGPALGTVDPTTTTNVPSLPSGASQTAQDSTMRTPSAQELEFNTRLKALLIKVAGAGNTPSAQQVKGIATEANAAARALDLARAGKLLDEAEGLLTPQQGKGQGPGSKVVFAQSRLAWDKTRQLVRAELGKLEAVILAECEDQPDFDVIRGNTRLLYNILEHLDERLIDKLDDAYGAQTEEERKPYQAEAREIVDEYIEYVKTDKTLQAIADNGFIDVAIMTSLNACLSVLAKQLKAAVTA